MTIVEGTRSITGGVDTHLDVHVAAALDDIGGLLGVESFEATTAGNTRLREWLASFGPVVPVGVEGTGSYGASLARSLRATGVEVVEVGSTTESGSPWSATRKLTRSRTSGASAASSGVTPPTQIQRKRAVGKVIASVR